MQTRKTVSVALLACVFLSAVLFVVAAVSKNRIILRNITNPPQTNNVNLKKFASNSEFKDYFSQRDAIQSITPKALGAPVESSAAADRVSQTNVQVKGIDEPDIIKTDGQNIFVSSVSPLFYPLLEKRAIKPLIYPYPQPVPSETKILSASPLNLNSKITESGDLLLNGKILVVFSNDKITGFDVTDSKSPKQIWQMKLEQNQIVSGRLLNGKIYTIIRNNVAVEGPCPLPLFNSIVIPCTEIYHPTRPISADSTYTIIEFDPADGNIIKKITFVGNSGNSVVYVSQESIYVTYTYSADYAQFYYNFLTQKATDLVSASVLEKLQKLSNYDISSQSKYSELNIILEEYKNSLTKDGRLKIDNELQNRLATYTSQHARELTTTGIIKISTASLDISAQGSVSGQPLNQFALDEYNHYLRIATTISPQFFFAGNSESTNDLHVLSTNLSEAGSLKDLGTGERIYSVRFIEDKGYLVTFKQIDPFFVIDLSDPSSPRLSGELKIPGFSSYLDPIAKNKILGVGEEGTQVKLSLFDVSSPQNPQEISKYNLDEYWTEVSNNHHAFLKDDKHEIFFIPGSKGAYIFSYSADTLQLKKAVDMSQVKRAIYINNNLYIIGEQEIRVFDESSWNEVANINL